MTLNYKQQYVYSKLYDEHISNDEYERATHVCDIFKKQNIWGNIMTYT